MKIPTFKHQISYSNQFVRNAGLILWKYKQEYRLLVVDNSIFSVEATKDLANLEFVDFLKKKLTQEVNYLRSKSIFTRLRIDTGKQENYGFALGIKDYFTALTVKNENKESLKLIQAGSYAYSFYQFLQKQQIINSKTKLNISAIGYSDRHISSLTVTPENIHLLENCYHIYRQKKEQGENHQIREKVINLIKRQAGRSFNNGKEFVEKLMAIPPRQSQIVISTETIDNFTNTAGVISPDTAAQLNLPNHLYLRDAHATLITQALTSKDNYLFLTGNPGIGKTTAVVKFLKEHFNEGFLFIYVSPRIQVNLDIIEKFKHQGQLCDPRLFCLTTNSHTINNNSYSKYQHSVEYISGNYTGDLTKKSVRFIPMAETQTFNYSPYSNLERKGEDLIAVKTEYSKGVLASLSEAIYTVIDGELSNQIVATTSLQAQKKLQLGDTLEHLHKIFKNAYNSTQNRVIPSRMQSISRRIKHLIIMIDEITGSENGVEFLHGIHQFCQKYQLFDSSHGFNTKVIVADASIVEDSVIAQHLSDKSPEPDKIFFRKAKSTGKALTKTSFQFQNKPATVINANSYPAKSLDITYKVFLEAKEFNENSDRVTNEQKSLITQLDETILSDLEQLWSQPGQILLYIQDKQKLEKILDKLSKKLGQILQKNQDYLEVKSNLSEVDKQNLHQYKNNPNIKLVLMTSAGSRGLSFPYVKHILVQIPNFQAEQNLMEILQVIYRGRGDHKLDQETKQLIFYLAEKVSYYPDQDPVLSKQEAIFNILNTLLLLKASILTRINGAGKLGRHDVILIPIGGKAITAAGESFSSRINHLLELLTQELRLNPEQKTLARICNTIKSLLYQTNFSVDKWAKSSDVSYLSQLETFQSTFSLSINQGLDQLLKLGNLESSYLVGSLLIVPIKSQLREDYYLSLTRILRSNSSQLLEYLERIRKNPGYNQNLRQATKQAIDLIKEIATESERSLQLGEKSKYSDQYYAIPLFTLLNLDILSKYFAEKKEEEEEETSFRKILEYYLKSLYSVSDFLPIGYQYQQFPFVLFRSYTLSQVRQKFFTHQYLFNSQELNVINLLLAEEDNS